MSSHYTASTRTVLTGSVRSQLESTQRQLAKVEQIEKVLRTQLGTLEDEVKLLDDLKVQNKASQTDEGRPALMIRS